MISKNKNTLITGIPRSGTSLILHLLSLDNKNICFSEPSFIKQIKQSSKNKEDATKKLSEELSNIRKKIINRQPLEFRVGKNSEIPDNYFQRSQSDNKSKIKKVSNFKNIRLPEEYSSRAIFVKNNLFFTSCLEGLVKSYEIIAIIRNPLSVLCSWQSLDLPISKGKVNSGLKFSKSLTSIVAEKDITLRQIKIMDWFYLKYKANKNNIRIIEYENLVEHPKKQLKKWIGETTSFPKLTSKNDNKFYSQTNKNILFEKIKKNSLMYQEIYKGNK